MRGRSSAFSPRVRTRLQAAAGVAFSLALAAPAAAAPLPPWVAVGDVPLPSWAKSVRVVRADEPIWAGPSTQAKKRGAAGREARLPLFGARAGAGCKGRWLNVGPFAWICDGAVELSGNDAVAANVKTFAETADGLPYHYFFVGPDGSFAYNRLESADVSDPSMQLDPGFSVAILEERTYAGDRYGRTSHHQWVPMRDLGPARPIAFQGRTLAGVSMPVLPEGTTTPLPMPFGWILPEKTKIRRSPFGPFTGEAKSRFEVVPAIEITKGPGLRSVKIADNAWISASDVRVPTRAAPPPEVNVAVGEKWIDVEIASQTLVAYEGATPVFATMVSTGKGRPGTPTATPFGTYRIWIKLFSTDMDNLEDENASRYYRMESVPYVQFFHKGYGLHGAYWHRSFGNVRSHGCVNLAPLDAQRLFWWTAPKMPAGWTASMPMPHDLGTVVRVR